MDQKKLTLPIEDALPELLQALSLHGQAVLQAPPGAGKTTRVPLALAEAGHTEKIVLLEPRRLAARTAAQRMADMWGEPLGQRLGYRIRGEAKPGTQIEVVTEGILTRMIQSDPELPGVGTVIFDEFHERSLQADLGLALALEVRGALRPDLQILVMSATLDAAPVAELMGNAPVITSAGRSHPVDISWLDKPLPKVARREVEMAALVDRALTETTGDVLAFLPGEGEIRRLQAALPGRADVAVRPLYGALPFADQRAAILPCETGRKVVLATSIAETSLTIEGVTAVVDGGQARRARFDPGSGMSRLVTERVSRAEATQRAGRAGRLRPGIAYRLWTKAEEGSFPAYAPAEIEAADLTGLALDLAAWGAADGDLAFLTPPPEGALAEARKLLVLLGALDARGGITAHGQALARLPVHPRLGHMLLRAGPSAAAIAALLSERDPMRGAGADLGLRLRALSERRLPGPVQKRLSAETKRLARFAGRADLPPEEALALAFPDRIGLRRPGEAPRWLLSGGRGAVMPEGDGLAGQRMIVAADLDGGTRDAEVRLAMPIGEAKVRSLFSDQMNEVHEARWDTRTKRVVARIQQRLGAVALTDQHWRDAPPEELDRAMLDGVRALGLRLSGAAARFAARVETARVGGLDVPAMDEAFLLQSAEDWLLPFLSGVRSAEDWANFDLLPALKSRLGWEKAQELEAAVPEAFLTPLGRRVPIDYSQGAPEVAVRLQEVFGQTQHPQVAGAPLKLVLLSPAGRPVQVTTDLPGFWAATYADVRKDMRGRYPKHPWPEDPTVAAPTTRTKPRRQP